MNNEGHIKSYEDLERELKEKRAELSRFREAYLTSIDAYRISNTEFNRFMCKANKNNIARLKLEISEITEEMHRINPVLKLENEKEDIEEEQPNRDGVINGWLQVICDNIELFDAWLKARSDKECVYMENIDDRNSVINSLKKAYLFLDGIQKNITQKENKEQEKPKIFGEDPYLMEDIDKIDGKNDLDER